MFCTNCGKNIRDDSKFCPYCGSSTVSASNAEEAAPASQVQPEQTVLLEQTVQPVQIAQPVQEMAPEQEEPGATGELTGRKKRRGLGVLLMVAVVAVAVCAAAVLLLGSLLGGPKVKVGRAVTKSLNAHTAMMEAVGADTMAKLAQSKEFNQTLSFKLKDLNYEPGYYGPDLGVLEGLDMKMTTSTSLDKRDISASIAASYGSADIMSATFQLKNDTATVFIPELMEGTAFGVNTVTLGKDLKRLDADEDLENISFNFFDITQAYLKPMELDKAATKALVKAIQVEKTGKQSLEVNDHTVQCMAYHVVVPEDAMKDWLNALKDCVKEQGYDDITLDMLRSIGIPEDEIDLIKDDIKAAASGSEMFDELKEAVKELGDLELDVYLNSGYVMGVVWKDRINGSRAEVGVYLGGGKNYVDDLSVEVEVDSEKFSFESSGDHAGKSGSYTDESVLRYKSDWSSYTMKSELNYQPKKAEDNFSWSIKGEDASFSMEGQLTAGKNSVSMQLDEVTVKQYGSELCTLEVGYSIAPYAGQSISAKKTAMLANMSEDDLEDLLGDIESEAMKWAEDLMDEIPELYEIFRYM